MLYVEGDCSMRGYVTAEGKPGKQMNITQSELASLPFVFLSPSLFPFALFPSSSAASSPSTLQLCFVLPDLFLFFR